MKAYCTFIPKERRISADQYKSFERNTITDNGMILWKNDEGSAAAMLIAARGVGKAALVTSEVVDERGNLAAGISVKAEFQKFISTYTGSNWIPEPRPFYPPKPPVGNRSFSADVIWGADIEEDFMVGTEEMLIQPFWITVSVSENAIPGNYEGEIRVILGDGEEVRLVQRIRVLNLKLDERDDYYLDLWQYPYASARYYGLQPFSPEHLAIVENLTKPYRKAGGKMGTASIVEEPWYHQTWCDYPSMVKWERQESKWSFDYTDFDKWVNFLLTKIGVSYIECFSIVPWENILRFREEGTERVCRAAPGTKMWEEIWSAFLKDFVSHLEDKGWFDRVILAMDERSEEEMAAALDLIESIRNKEGKALKTGGYVGSFHPQLWERLFVVTPHISNICEKQIPLPLFRNVAGKRRSEGKLTGLYSMIADYPGIFSMSDPGEAAWTIWYAEFCGTDGFVKWAYDAWCEKPLEDNAHSYFEAGDMFLIYPGEYQGMRTEARNSPRFSIMSEAIRDIKKIRQMRRKYPELEEKIGSLIESVHSYYGLGRSNGIGTAGFRSADEGIRSALEEEVKRLHRETGKLSVQCELLKNKGKLVTIQPCDSSD